MLVAVFVSVLVSAAFSCQNQRIIAEDGSVVVGRSLEFSELPVPAGCYIWTEPANTKHCMADLPNCDKPFEFTSDYKIARFQVKFDGKWANTTLGGMNDQGLAASTLYFTDYAKFCKPEKVKGDQCQNAVPQTQLSTYVLAKYKSVADLKKDLKHRKFPKVWDQGDLGMPTIPVHYVFHDTTGQGLVLEYTKLGMKFYDNTVGAMTNSPDYKWHMVNLRNYPTLQRTEWKGFEYEHLGKKYTLKPSWVGTGFSGMPGDYSSPSRFIKAATMVSHSGKAKDADHAVNRMFHMLNAADIPKGISVADIGGHSKKKKKKKKKGEEHADYTWWISVYDLSRNCVYYRGYDDLSIKRICLDSIPEVRSCIDVDGTLEDGIKDMIDDLKPMKKDSEETVEMYGY